MLELKLRPPIPRAGHVRRSDVLTMLCSASDTPVISIVAPAGYGKTTAMGQFQHEYSDGPTAWITLDASDSDPTVLFRSLIGAFGQAGMLDESMGSSLSLRSNEVLTVGISALTEALFPIRHGVLLVDQVDHLLTQSARDVVGAVMTRIAGPIQVILASRSAEGLPIPLLRSQEAIVELSASDLAMGVVEAAQVFEAAGVPMEASGIETAVERTEGWPVGVYLTAVALKAGAPTLDAAGVVGGDDLYLADYLRTELLSQVPDSTMGFLLRTSILSRLTGPLCDFVLENDGSALILSKLETSNLLIVPIDRTRTWYRYHSLLRDYLRSELVRRYPNEVPRLHSRAATWFEDHGLPDDALDHVRSAGEAERLGELIFQNARTVYAEGRVETVSTWFDWLEESKTLFDLPELAALGAFARALDGDAGGSERMAGFAFRDDLGNLRHDAELGPFALMLRAYQVRRGVDEALRDARAAHEGFESHAQWIHVALAAESLAIVAKSGIEAAEPAWTDGLWRSESLGAHPHTSLAKAERALASIARDDWLGAEQSTAEALGLIRAGGLERYVTSGLVFTVAARIAARHGEMATARTLIGQAMSVRPRLTIALPLLTLQTSLEMARAFMELADVGGARQIMRDAADLVAVRPRMGLLVDEFETLKERLGALPAGTVGPSSLTGAEIRLLPLLVTHLTYPEIGDRLFLSRHTVKTQAMSIYRKLGVSSRAEAVTKARDLGILSL
jgi:LuxR family maltose regulon positive regulatory protein